MSEIIFFDELSKEAQKYASCLVTMKLAIELEKPILKKQMTREAVSKFKNLIPELKMVINAMEYNRYFPCGLVTENSSLQSSEKQENVLKFSFTSDYSVEPQNLSWSPTSPVHTVMFGEIDEPIDIKQDELDIKLEK